MTTYRVLIHKGDRVTELYSTGTTKGAAILNLKRQDRSYARLLAEADRVEVVAA